MPELALNINQKKTGVEQLAPREKSAALFKLASSVLPGGINSPVRAFRGYLPFPLVVRSAEGAYLRDADGRRYLDLVNSWGALIHGHCHPEIQLSISEQLKTGWGFGALCEIEAHFAVEVCEAIERERIRFVSSGTEATMTALRLARASNGRSMVLKFNGHYHGHSDQLLVQAGSGVLEFCSQDAGKIVHQQPSSMGVPQEMVQSTHSIPFNDMQALENYFQQWGNQTAAVILEPITGNMGTVPADRRWMQRLEALKKEYGAVLIFDEVMTGFRLSLKGSEPFYGIKADLSCYGKVIGGGLPAAAVAGSAYIMDQLAPLGRVYQAGTLSGNPLAMASGLASLKLLKAEGFYERLEAKAQLLEKPIIDAIEKGNYPVCWQRIGSMMNLFFQPDLPKNVEAMAGQDLNAFTAFFRFMFERGVLVPPSPFEAWFLSDAYEDEQLDQVGYNVVQFLKTYY